MHPSPMPRFLLPLILLLASPGLMAQLSQSPLSCVLVPNRDIEVASPIPGVVQQVMVQRGAPVNAGDALFQLNDQIERASLQRYQTQVEFAQRQVDRNQNLRERGLLSQQQQDELDTDLALARRELAEAQAAVDIRTIRSSISGYVLDRLVDEGEYVGENPVVRLVSIDPLYAEMLFVAADFGKVQPGQIYQLNTPGFQFGPLQAEVQLVDPIIDAASGTFGARLLVQNPENRIPAGIKCGLIP